MIRENGTETCIISYVKRIASPGSMQDTGCLGLVHWDDPEGWYEEGGGSRAVTLVPGLEPNARNAGEKRLAAGGCLQACTGKDRVSFHTGGAPALRPGAIAQSPGRE